jgi:vacuolar-type H+-ATPase subunit E/Vma4
MPLEDILARISRDTEARKSAILEKASEEAKARLQKAEEEIRRESARLLERRKREVEAEIQRKMAEIKLQSRHEIGKVKSEAMAVLRRKLAMLFLAEIEKAYESWWKKILLHYVQDGDEEVWMFPREADKLGRKFLEKINQKANYRLCFGGVLDDRNERGFVLKKGGMDFSVAFSTILDDFLKENESFIVKTLFQGVGE